TRQSELDMLRSDNVRWQEKHQAVQKSDEDNRQALARERAALAEARQDNSRLEERLKAEQQAAEDRLKTVTEAREQMTHQFKTLSQEILEEKSKAFNEAGKATLEPLI